MLLRDIPISNSTAISFPPLDPPSIHQLNRKSLLSCSRVPVYIRDASRRSGRFIVGTLIVKNLISVDAEAGVLAFATA